MLLTINAVIRAKGLVTTLEEGRDNSIMWQREKEAYCINLRLVDFDGWSPSSSDEPSPDRTPG
jgi:hypothetical protein